jgi:hypothetical protein
MNWAFEYHDAGAYLEVHVTGLLSHDGLNAMARERWAEMEKRNCRKILFDFSRVESALSVADIYARPAETERMGVPRLNRTAAVVPERFLQEFKFMETVYKNRGFDLNVFTRKDEALRYLEQAV